MPGNSDIHLINAFIYKEHGCIAPMKPLGILYIASFLEAHGFSVAFSDVQTCKHPEDIELLADEIRLESSVVGIGCMHDTLPLALLLGEALKRRDSTITLVYGGAGPSGVCEPLMTSFDFIDFIVSGEGEETMLELLGRLQRRGPVKVDDVPGLYYRANGHVAFTGARARIRDITSLPLPAYHKLNFSSYHEVSHIVAHRGCPYQCTFCDVAGNYPISREIDAVIDEMEMLWRDHGVKTFSFTDEIFVLNHKYVSEFCKRYQTRGVGARWAACGRVDRMTDDLLAQMKDSNCYRIFFGTESGSDAVLAEIKKRITAKDTARVVAKAARQCEAIASFIWGFPMETVDQLIETLRLASFLKYCGATIYLGRLAPLPLAELYAMHREDLRLGTSSTDFFMLTYKGDLRSRVRKMVAAHPNIFTGFYYYHTQNYLAKESMVDRFLELTTD